MTIVKFIKLEYPDQSIHNIMVTTFGYNKKLNKYFIHYYDMAESKAMYTILEKNEDILLKDPFQDKISYAELTNNYKDLDVKLLPKEISCKKTADKAETQSVALFIVYNTGYGLYINENLCQRFNIGKENKAITIKGIKCYEVSTEEIDSIEKTTEKENPALKAKYESVYEVQTTARFIVYHTTNTNEFFIAASICERYGIRGIRKTTIEGITHYKVTKEDIEKIETLTANNNPCLKAEYKDIYLKREKVDKEVTTTRQSQKAFVYYNDLTNHKLYIDRKIYELAKELKIGIEGKAKIIDNKNCYSLTLTQLKQIEQASNYKGIEKNVVLEKDDTISTPVIAYQDQNSGTIYLPTKYNLVNPENHNLKRIMNKECIEMTISELEQIYNQKIILVSVYLKERKKKDIIICCAKDKFYISEADINSLTDNSIGKEKIRVDGQIYYHITESDMVEIKKAARKQDIEVNFTFKSITPVNKKHPTQNINIINIEEEVKGKRY